MIGISEEMTKRNENFGGREKCGWGKGRKGTVNIDKY